MEENNEWLDLFEFDQIDATDKVVETIKSLINVLNKKTEGKVKGRFIRLKKINSLMEIGKALSKVANSSLMVEREISEENENLSIIKMSDVYKEDYYGFDIYTEKYKFRIFELDIAPLYPIEMSIDSGIIDNVISQITEENIKINKETNKVIIQNDYELKRILYILFENKKVLYLIKQLMTLE